MIFKNYRKPESFEQKQAVRADIKEAMKHFKGEITILKNKNVTVFNPVKCNLGNVKVDGY